MSRARRYARSAARHLRGVDQKALDRSLRRSQQSWDAHLDRVGEGVRVGLDGMHGDVRGLRSAVSEFAAELRATRGRVEHMERMIARPPAPPSTALAESATTDSPLLTGLRVDGAEPRVVLVLNTFSISTAFAGVRTAVVVAAGLAQRLGRPLAVIVLGALNDDPETVRTDLIAWLGDEFDSARLTESLTLSAPEHRIEGGVHPDDIWVATFWTTAVQLGRRCERGELSPDHVVHLVQDWEPAFYAWGTEYALAASTFDLDFHLLVNSRSLADYVTGATGREFDPAQVIAPNVDQDRLRWSAEYWRPGVPEQPRVLFYARPGKPRNLYPLGLAALRHWAAALPEGVTPIVTFAGEDIAEAPDLGRNVAVRIAGKTTLDEYYRLLAATDIGLTLMLSPHPSHLALELPMTGIPAVTNALSTYRRAWLPELIVAAPTPTALANGLSQAQAMAAGRARHDFVALDDAQGSSLDTALDSVVSNLPVGTTGTTASANGKP